MKNKAAAMVVSLLLTVSAVFGSVSADISQPPLRVPPLENVHCASYCVYDKTANEVILGVDPDKKVYPASQTKIMTCQLGLDYLNIDDYLTVSQNAMNSITSDSSIMGVSVGETVQISELLYGLMLPSGNDAANVIAEGVVDAMFEKYPAGGGNKGPDGVDASYLTEQLGKTEDEIKSNYKLRAFACLMNLRARNIGCTGTNFVNASGLHDDNHYTTSHDLALMMAKACENRDFKILISTESHIFKATNRHTNDAWKYVKNSDYLLFDPWLAAQTGEGIDSHLIAIIGGKTGTTSMAGKGLTLSTVNENGHELMISICGIPADYYYYTTMYAASVTAYGHLECWNRNPETVLPGTTGDYRYVNAPDAQQPKYDSLIFPGDELVNYIEEEPEATPTPVATPTPTPVPVGEQVKTHPLVLFAKEQPVVAVVCCIILLAIIIINIILFVRIRQLKANARRRKVRKPNGLI
ncbi:D-alanyl-D-alanine carboxypeptidase [Ruminococcaceae bacterium YRB3002]|nr:D-alanyl-D-alanine carboxypeptidase [Ruminococcaceae bacterium YRB3002]